MRSRIVELLQCCTLMGGLLAGWSGVPATLLAEEVTAPTLWSASTFDLSECEGGGLPPIVAPRHVPQQAHSNRIPVQLAAYQLPQSLFDSDPDRSQDQPGFGPGSYATRAAECQASCPPGGECKNNIPQWFDHFDLFGGLDGSKQPQDFGVNALFGGRVAVNAGWFLSKELGLGLQAATSLNVSDNAVQVFERLGSTSHRVQNYSTLALYQRTAAGFNWGFGFDLLRENYYDQFLLGQWRGKGGYLVTKTDEFGAWFTIPQIHDEGSFAGVVPLTLKPIQQAALFWTHQWEAQAFTTVWAGYSRTHGEVNLALGDLAPVSTRPSFGAELHVPLNDNFALYGQANFLSPFDTGTVDSFLGITFYPGGGARRAPAHGSTPVLPVANNTMFSTDLTR